MRYLLTIQLHDGGVSVDAHAIEGDDRDTVLNDLRMFARDAQNYDADFWWPSDEEKGEGG